MSAFQNSQKLALAVIAATLVACVTALLSGFVEVIFELVGSVNALTEPSVYEVGLYIGVAAMAVASFVCPLLFVIVGLPLYALLLRLRWVDAWHFAVVGVGVSSLTAVGAYIAFPIDRDLAVPLVIVGGTFASLAFWYVARPDRLARQPVS